MFENYRRPVGRSNDDRSNRGAVPGGGMINVFGYYINSTSLSQAFDKWSSHLLAAGDQMEDKLDSKGAEELAKIVKNVTAALQQLPLLSSPDTAKTAISDPKTLLNILSVDMKRIGTDLVSLYHIFSSLVEVIKKESGIEATRLLGTAFVVLTDPVADQDMNERFGRLLGEHCRRHLSYSLNDGDSPSQNGHASSTEDETTKKGAPAGGSYATLFTST